MSSGFFSFFAHTGVALAFQGEGFVPSRMGGSSAGALVSGMWASGTDPNDSAKALLELERSEFWDPAIGFGVLAGRKFQSKVEALLSAKTFEECRVPLAVSVFDVLTRATRSESTGDLAPAIVASCTVPVMFHPVWLRGRPTLDGGILDRPGLLGMPHGERLLYHHIVSRSPWRKKNSEAIQIPSRDNMMTLAIDGLPRSGPFRLGEGKRAMHLAREAALRAMDLPIDANVIRISC